MPVSRSTNRNNSSSHNPKMSSRTKHQLSSSLLSDDDGVDSPTYDGDIESSTTAGLDGHSSSKTLAAPLHHHRNSSGSTLTSPVSTVFPQTLPTSTQTQASPRLINHSSPPVFLSHPSNTIVMQVEEPAPAAPTQAAFNPASLTPEDIRAFVRNAIEGESWRKYKINSPPTNRPVRVYADGSLQPPSSASTSLTL